jgi:hypothetical protein
VMALQRKACPMKREKPRTARRAYTVNIVLAIVMNRPRVVTHAAALPGVSAAKHG